MEKSELTLKNSIFTIFPYKKNGTWMFDDEKVGLREESFVSGADTLLDKLANGREQVVALFSENPFPDAQLKLDRIGEQGEYGGTDYRCEELGHDLWLCGALNLYYPSSPRNLFIKIK